MPLIDISDTYQMTNVGAHIDATEVSATHPNLFANSWFTVNQRGETSGSVVSATYTRDRWIIARANYVFNNNGSVTTKWDGSGAGAFLIQYTPQENYVGLENQTVTISAYIDGTLRSKTITLNNSAGTYDFGGGVTLIYNRHNANGRGIEIQFRHSSTTGITIAKPKLELGSVSTLANDTPPDPAEELAKCQYYFRRIQASTGIAVGFGFMAAPTSGYISIPATMRTSGTISCAISGSATLRGAGASGTVTAITVAGHAKEFVRLNATISGSIAGNNPAVLVLDTNAYIDLSADL